MTAPRHADDFADLRARRDWIAGLPKSKPRATNDNRIERALVAEANPLVETLRKVVELMRPAEVAATVDLEGDSEREDNSGYGTERKHNQGSITPSIPKLLDAYADGMRTRVVSLNGVVVGRVCTSFYRDGNGEVVLIGGTLPDGFHGLQFFCGELVAYGEMAKGGKWRRRQPKYIAGPIGATVDEKSETHRHRARQQSEAIAYLQMPGTAPYLPTSASDAPRSITAPPRTSRAMAAAAMLANAANDNVPITKLPDGVASEYGRLGGMSETKGAGATKAPRHHALDEMERAETFAGSDISADDIEVVDSILGNDSFRAIGLRLGYAESSAHRSGRQAVVLALQKISKKIAA